jgi:hypothetical protein
MIFPIFQICPIIFVFVAESTETARVIVENWNQRLKNYNSIFEKPWRHNEDRHCQTLNVLSNLINIELNHGHPLRKNE